jgi:tRNA (pseudouridine54-N1)-methyltransferase
VPSLRRFVLIGRRAITSPEFSLVDLPGTSGRLDVLVRALRAALLVSHGVRRDSVAYLVLEGPPRPPRAIRVDGAAAKYLRPDERSLATIVRKALAFLDEGPARDGFVDYRSGISIANGGLDAVLADIGDATHWILEEGAEDVRVAPLETSSPVFFVGDHLGFADETRARLGALGARPIGIGPVSLHAEDAIAVVHNELDRRAR